MTSFHKLRIPLAFAALGSVLVGGTPAAAQSCQSETFEEDRYIVCGFDLSDADIRLFWRQPDGGPYATFSALAAALELEGMRLDFAMNGGMYGDDLTPIGLHVEDAKTLRKVNTATSQQRPAPNFYKKPNGVFYIGDGTAGVMTTEDYLARPPGARFATQSGPMLVIDGDLHPAFIVDSDSRKPRNGVCAPTATEVRFVITEGIVNFYDFGRFVRDHLGCDNALFLDGGSAPGIYAPELGRDDPPGHGGYGPIIGVVSGGERQSKGEGTVGSEVRFASLAELMEVDARGELTDHEFEVNLQLLLGDFYAPDEVAALGDAPLAYYASWLMEWQVGGEGFVGAAYNVPHWFDAAAFGYRAIGLEDAAALIDRATVLVGQGETRGEAFVDIEEAGRDPNDLEVLGALSDQFKASRLAKLEEEADLEEVGWWAEEARLRYVRENRDAFAAIPPIGER